MKEGVASKGRFIYSFEELSHMETKKENRKMKNVIVEVFALKSNPHY